MSRPAVYDHADIVRRYKSGEVGRIIAESLGCSEWTVWNAVRRDKQGLPMRSGTTTRSKTATRARKTQPELEAIEQKKLQERRELLERVEKLYLSGVGPTRISAVVNMSTAWVYDHLKYLRSKNSNFPVLRRSHNYVGHPRAREVRS